MPGIVDRFVPSLLSLLACQRAACRLAITVTLTLFTGSKLSAGLPDSSGQSLQRPASMEFVQFDANRIQNWFGNNGHAVSHVPTGSSGLEWPKGSGLRAVFTSGIWLAGLVNGEIHTAAAEFSSEWQPGHVGYQTGSGIPGTPSDPGNPLSQVYSIGRGDCSDPQRDCYNWEFANWPTSLGAPARDGEYFTDSNGNGRRDHGEAYEDFNLDAIYNSPDGRYITGEDPPDMSFDQHHWYVANDLNEGSHANLWSTPPLGIELQVSSFGFNEGTPLDNVQFFRYLLVNKGGNSIEDLYFGHWTDADVGDANDDYAGCDTSLDLTFFYNGELHDQDYGLQTPAVGFALLQGAIIPSAQDSAFYDGAWHPGKTNIRMTSNFAIHNSGTSGFDDAENAEEAYNELQGLTTDGEAWHEYLDPNHPRTSFHYAGDPVMRNGWTMFDDQNPRDHRALLGSGPFDLPPWNDENGDDLPQPGESGVQEIVIAIIVCHGLDHLDAITNLRYTTRFTRSAWYRQFEDVVVPAPMVNVSPLDGEVVLSWAEGAEELESFTEAGYSFEGYKVFQGYSRQGPWEMIGIFDLENGIRVIRKHDYDLESGVLSTGMEHGGTDSGLEHLIAIEDDMLKGGPLIDYKAYHFAVTAYSVDVTGEPVSFESELLPITVRPHPPKLGTCFTVDRTDSLKVLHVGDAEARVFIEVQDPLLLTGDDYSIGFVADTLSGQLTWFLGRMRYEIMVDTLFQRTVEPGERTYEWNGVDYSYFYDYSDSTGMIDGFRVFIDDVNTKIKRYNHRWEQTVNVETGGLDSVAFLAISPGGVDSLVWTDGYGSDTMNVDSLVCYRWNRSCPWEYARWEERGAETYIWLYREYHHDVLLQSFASDVGGVNHLAASIPGIGNGITADSLLTADIEIRFTENGQKALSWGPATGFVPQVSEVPFEIWDVENDFQLCIGHVDWNSTGSMFDPEEYSLEGDWLVTMHVDYETYQDSLLEFFGSPYSGWLLIFNTSSRYSVGDELYLQFLNPIKPGVDRYQFTATKPGRALTEIELQDQLERIQVFPNPYFGQNMEEGPGENFITFIGLPGACTLRIFTLAGIHVRTIEHGQTLTAGTPFEPWDLRNEAGEKVASGMYIVRIDVPRIGNKILKLAVLQSAYE